MCKTPRIVLSAPVLQVIDLQYRQGLVLETAPLCLYLSFYSMSATVRTRVLKIIPFRIHAGSFWEHSFPLISLSDEGPVRGE